MLEPFCDPVTRFSSDTQIKLPRTSIGHSQGTGLSKHEKEKGNYTVMYCQICPKQPETIAQRNKSANKSSAEQNLSFIE
jgi:hypothetical protein